MANIIKRIILFKLKLISKAILLVHKPFIIGITGSFGKTSTKEAIKKVLEGDFRVYSTTKSFNTDFGLPLTIILSDLPKNYKNIFAWAWIMLKGIAQVLNFRYPKVLILEYGADKPGDINYLLSIAKPNISVITAISGVHLEKFKTIENIVEEKSKLVTKVPGVKAVLNKDFAQIQPIKSTDQLGYGINEKTDIQAINLINNLTGLSFDILFKGKKYSLKTRLFGEFSSYNLLASFGVGIYMGLEPEKIVGKLSSYEAYNGRMHLLKGVNGSMVVDDSYNSSPEAAIKAIDTIGKFKGKNRLIYCLGSMNELGDMSEEDHKKVGEEVAKYADVLVTIGEMAGKWLGKEAIKEGLNKKFVHVFDEPFTAGEFLKSLIKEGDLVLVKGSQNGVFSEEAVKAIIDESYDPNKVLVRQSTDWLKKKSKLKENVTENTSI